MAFPPVIHDSIRFQNTIHQFTVGYGKPSIGDFYTGIHSIHFLVQVIEYGKPVTGPVVLRMGIYSRILPVHAHIEVGAPCE